MKIKHYFLFPVVIFSLCAAMTACSGGPQSPQGRIDRLAKDMQKELPRMLDRDTRLARVYTGRLELVSEYELVNYEMDPEETGLVRNSIENYLSNTVCPSIKEQLLDQGVKARYLYRDNTGQTVVDRTLAAGDCK